MQSLPFISVEQGRIKASDLLVVAAEDQVICLLVSRRDAVNSEQVFDLSVHCGPQTMPQRFVFDQLLSAIIQRLMITPVVQDSVGISFSVGGKYQQVSHSEFGRNIFAAAKKFDGIT